MIAFLAKVGEWQYINTIDANWDSIREEKTQAIISSIQNSFQVYQRETFETAHRIAVIPGLGRYVSVKSQQRELFSLLEQAKIVQEMSVELYNRHGELLAWWGTTAGLQHAQVDVQRETSFVSAGPVYSYLTVVVRAIEKQEIFGFVVVHRLFDVNYPFNNRFISSAAFTQTFPRRLDYAASFDFSNQRTNLKKVKAIEIPLRAITGSTVGYAFVDELSRSTVIERVQLTVKVVTSGSLAIVSIILFIVVVQFIHRSQQPLLRLLGVSALIWLLRYSWLWFDFSSSMIYQGIFDPRFFASPFGFGIAKSIGELFITSVALLGNIMYIAYRLLPVISKHREDELTSRVRWQFRESIFLVLFPLLAIVMFFFHRGFTAVVRSAVFDSTLPYSDPTLVLPSLELAAMLLNLFFIAAAFVIASILVIIAAHRIMRLWFRNYLTQTIIVGTTFIVIGLLFGLLHPSPLVGPITRILIFSGLFLVAVVFYRRLSVSGSLMHSKNSLPLMNVVLSIVVTLTILVYQLDHQVHQRERRNIELLGAELTRPVDAWVTYVLEQTLSDMVNDENVEALTFRNTDKLRSLAFTLWSRSLLSRVGYNCGVFVYDTEKHLISNFRIGIQQTEIVPIYESSISTKQYPGIPRIRVIEQEGQRGKRKTYAGSIRIVNWEGNPIGTIDVVISAGEHLFFASETPPILQTYEREETERYLRSLVISEFVDGKLVYTTGDDVPYHVQPPDVVMKHIHTEGALWVDEKVGDSEYETFYMRVDNASNENTVLALGWKKIDWRWHVFNFLRHLLFYLLVCGGLAVALFIALSLRGYPVTINFRTKLFLAFFVVSLLPLLFIAYYNRDITIERANQSIVERLRLETAVVNDRMIKDFQGNSVSSNQFMDRCTDEWCESVAAELGTDFSIYVDAVKKASSKPELFQAEILDSRLSAYAFLNIALEGKNFYVENRMIGNYDYLVGYRPLTPHVGKREHAVLSVPLLYSQVEITQDLTRRNALLFGAYAVVMMLASIVGTLFANQISSPIRQLIAATHRIASGELNFRIPTSRKDEIGELHQAFNRMTEDLKHNRESLIKAERELAWKEMAKQVAHEIKNPLTPIKLSIQHLRQAFHDRDSNFPQLLEQVTKTIIDQIDTLSRIASQFAHFARMPERREENVRLQEVVSEAVKLFGEHADVTITFVGPSEPLTVRADREELRRAFINIIRNAVQAMNEKGSITITATSDQEYYRISLADTGPGIPEDVRSRLFEPNFSTKSEGMGLGLAMVKKTIDDLQGQIDIQSEIGKGTTVRIVIPRKNGKSQ